MMVAAFWKLDENQCLFDDYYVFVSDEEDAINLVQKLADIDQETYHLSFYDSDHLTAFAEGEGGIEREIVSWKLQSRPIHVIEPRKSIMSQE